MRTTRLSAAVAATVALATLGLANTVAAADTVGFEYDVSCDGGGYIDINIDINADDPNDRFLIELDGVTLDSDVPPGDSQFLNQGPFDDGMVQLWVKTDPGAQVVFGWEIPVTCDGPIVEIESQCNDDNDGQFINVGLWDSDTQTFNVWVAGVLVGNGVESNDTSGYLGYGSYPLGEIQVDVDWLENPDDNPYVSTLVDAGDCTDDDSGAGIPDAGSKTAPLLVGATVLTLGGIALLGTRRLRRA